VAKRNLAVLRWLLLCATLVGLAAMHTLGHDGFGHGMAMSRDRADPASHAAMWTAAAHQHHAGPSVLSPCQAGCDHLAAGHPGNGHPEGWSVCLAVLAALAAVVLLAWLRRPTGRANRPAAPGRHLGVGPRAPPRPRLALRLVELSVLRT
jgi:hypothetical protein